jgi:hypothetical protein
VTYVIALPCVDLLDKTCIDECPVDCISEGNRMLNQCLMLRRRSLAAPHTSKTSVSHPSNASALAGMVPCRMSGGSAESICRCPGRERDRRHSELTPDPG